MPDDTMPEPSQTDRMSNPLVKDHAQILDMLNSTELQKRLEEARAKRARILADRAADAKADPPSATPVPTAVAPDDVAAANVRTPTSGLQLAAALPDDTATERTAPSKPIEVVATVAPDARVEASVVPPPAETVRRKPPVLRAPPRLVGAKPTRIAQRPAPVRRRRVQPLGVALGLVLGGLAGVGVTWVLGISQHAPSDMTATVSAASGVEAAPIIAIDAEPLVAAPADASRATLDRSIKPKARPTRRASVTALPDWPAAGPDAGRPGPPGSVDGQRLPSERRSAATVPDLAIPPPSRIDIDEILRSATRSRSAAVPDRSVQVPARPATTVAPPVPPGIAEDDAATRPRATKPDVATVASSAQPRRVVHIPPARPAMTVAPPVPSGIAEDNAATRPGAKTPDVAAVASGARLRTVVHIPPAFPQDALADIRGALGAVGVDLADMRTVRFSVARNQVRYFHARDAADAARIAEAIGTEARDFSSYRPSPSVGTLEVWLAD